MSDLQEGEQIETSATSGRLPESAAKSPTPIEALNSTTAEPTLPLASVRALLLRRVRYVVRYLFWTIRHCSPKHAAWICEFEGITWN